MLLRDVLVAILGGARIQKCSRTDNDVLMSTSDLGDEDERYRIQVISGVGGTKKLEN